MTAGASVQTDHPGRAILVQLRPSYPDRARTGYGLRPRSRCRSALHVGLAACAAAYRANCDSHLLRLELKALYGGMQPHLHRSLARCTCAYEQRTRLVSV
jgi:hypothetical protein